MFPIEGAPRLRTSELPGSRRACLERAVGERPRDRAGGELVPIERAMSKCMGRLVVTLSRGGEARRPPAHTSRLERQCERTRENARKRPRENDPERANLRTWFIEPPEPIVAQPVSCASSGARASTIVIIRRHRRHHHHRRQKEGASRAAVEPPQLVAFDTVGRGGGGSS